MATILHIETATKNCSVSVAIKGELLALQELNDGNYSHAEKLHPFIQQVMKKAKLSFNDIDAVAVSKGPGSYTGLRIGVSAAKGLCFAFDKPLISIETLQSLAHKVSVKEGVVVPMLDARRMEVYAAVYNSKYEQVRDIKAEIINESSFEEYLSKGKVYFIGDGAEKCKGIIVNENAVFIDGEFPSAKEMVQLSLDKYKKNDIEDVAYFEPFYLKDFVVTPEKKR
ncbi:tRNA threonylcarbamoyladenosine biosynthesis protein TsaB [Tenacibaculum mesophilum]|uniref:tRNA (Adenosine(37)-N6)-threonylcarbamoyltransferase complex dimerization subunit type 1 TsaB n=1 Tax=Tenacibaculum mesophilum TaxID=104268 RepID=A0ABM7CGF5_9FLAO|nr:tRNA (adenosine(37)-N6)-threonylcarbamoyltransferase complex dimerization subunit type 1 TsaB [Tenacibaculum mesophilum]AZJ32843.1 tRNA (adenosine(37)-N6)-threonylcarbamoyltransferase complex dimerization subunit type 1 TsaB [Tenacibaculum mesophilum]QFS28090.1 tRNA (adenosine(37)-N6)-threonylcarbamoyltransferase complex dimerization subunit type 1 TsaB [Tenacibaculum mesophilum]SHF72973.1 tRNA threonylcarbamoyladenosine biosynthesis protein TsaB [Tenacibaculum mesophilum]